MSNQAKIKKGNQVIKQHVMLSMGAGLVPVPLVDMAAVTAIQMDMLRQLSNLFGVEYSQNSGKILATALTGGSLSKLMAMGVKIIPGIGSWFGGVSMSLISGASTYAVGKVVLDHLCSGGNLFTFDPDAAKPQYDRFFKEGKEKVADMKQN